MPRRKPQGYRHTEDVSPERLPGRTPRTLRQSPSKRQPFRETFPITVKATLYLFTYNHDDFIDAAFTSALEQTYEPLQIVVWDNHSTTRNFEIIQDLANDYRGPHELLLHRSDHNYFPGLESLNLASRLWSGQYIVVLSGDDYCTPNRVQRIVEEYQRTGAMVMSSAATIIDHDGNIIGSQDRVVENDKFEAFSDAMDFARAGGCAACAGSGLAFHRQVFTKFGPLRIGPRNMDQIIPFRGAVLGGCHYIQEPLVYRRVHDGNVDLNEIKKRTASKAGKRLVEERNLSNRVANFMVMKEDLDAYRGRHPDRTDLAEVAVELDRRLFLMTRRWVRFRYDMMMDGVGVA